LDPDQLEKREHLKKISKDCDSLVEQLENKVANIRAGLEAQKKGRINLKTPSLASIDNTCIMLESSILAQTKRLESLSRDLKANPLSTLNMVPRKSMETSDGNPSMPTALTAKRVVAALNAERVCEQWRINLVAMMKQPLLTTRVITSEEAMKKRDPTLPVFRQVTNLETPAKSHLNAPSLESSSLPSASISRPVPPSTPTPNITPSPQTTPHTLQSVNRRSSHTLGKDRARAVHVSNSSPKTPPTFTLPSDFSWGALPNTKPSPSPSPSPNILFKLSPDLRPKEKS